jgi:hypothetical protein
MAGKEIEKRREEKRAFERRSDDRIHSNRRTWRFPKLPR